MQGFRPIFICRRQMPKGSRPTHDTHDVLVLQSRRFKNRRSYDVPMELPLLGQKFSSDKYTTMPYRP
jgi:hypothetical protein